MDGYQIPPEPIVSLVDSPPAPVLRISPKGDNLLLLYRCALPALADISQPELKLAGLRFAPSRAPSRTRPYVRVQIQAIPADCQQPADPARNISGLPPSPRILSASFSPSGELVALVNVEEGAVKMYVVCVATQSATLVEGLSLNHCLSGSVAWVDDTHLVAKCVTMNNLDEAIPSRPLTPSAPVTSQTTPGSRKPARTYQDLLKDAHDDQLFQHYLTSQVHHIRLTDKAGRVAISAKPLSVGSELANIEGLVWSITPSPDGSHLLVSEIRGPFSHSLPYMRFPLVRTVYRITGHGTCVRVNEVATLPLADSIPVLHNSCREGRRNVMWCDTRPSSLVCVEALDKGNPANAVEHRDAVYLLDSSDGFTQQIPVIKTTLRFHDVEFLDDTRALVTERWWKSKSELLSLATLPPPGYPTHLPASLVWERCYEDAYASPGVFVRFRHPILHSYHPQLVDDRYLLMEGRGASPQGNRPFVDLFNITCPHSVALEDRTVRLFQLPEGVEAYENPTVFGFTQDRSALRCIISHESITEPRNYRLQHVNLKGDVEGDQASPIVPLTAFPHPYPALSGMTKQLIKYTRRDGVELSGVLYLPPGGEGKRLPLLLWAYPREFGSRDTASQVLESPYTFVRLSPTSPLVWLTQGWAVLANPAFPIVATTRDSASANDTFVTQLVQSAESAVLYVCDTLGAGDRDRVAVGGHSYGAFMAANLLAHAPGLFRCGIARSGAYNRSLTPFGFQAEDRTYWEAPHIYHAMSPFSNADKMKDPLLLIHGMEDPNSGTHPMQSERMFQALQGLGKHSRLVLLPKEGHSYMARESVLHVLAETHAWLEASVQSPRKNSPRTPRNLLPTRTLWISSLLSVSLVFLIAARGR